MSPSVTVGMPVLNNMRTLQRAIYSIQDQSFSDWQLIISDDGSTDGSVRIAEKAVAEDSRIRLVRQPARLHFMNFRAPLDLADTDYFAWLAGDDYWHRDFLRMTHAALEAAPSALSALPQAAFIGPPVTPVPHLGFLRGNASERIARYLAHPGGTRMYGLMRTKALSAAFPPRAFNAWDWYLMTSLLADGPQLSLPQRLMFREETPWFRYTEVVDELTNRWLYRRLPILEMSLQLIRDRRTPLGALPALAALNLRKHEEYFAVNHPAKYRRRRRFYRSIGMPIASRQGHIAAPFAACAGSALPSITAILTFRNAARTLPAAIDHLQALGCAVVAIDNGSTDESRAIAQDRRGAARGKILDAPRSGTFDLLAQLTQKRGIIRSLGSGWVLHADADEFLDPPDGLTLEDCVAEADRSGRIAFPVEEHLFVPRFEDEEHDPDSFTETMTAFVQMREHNPKQRLFRADADLGFWMRTGGHTVTMDSARLAKAALVLRHYPGLSLDDLRSQYHSRVFSAADRARMWHSNRVASRDLDIVEPDATKFAEAKTVTQHHLPFFSRRNPMRTAALSAAVDLYLLHDCEEQVWSRIVDAALPGLRMATIEVEALWSMTRCVPVLQILGHPSSIHGQNVRRSVERIRATNWTRRIAQARQWAVDRNAVYAEIRSEDAVARPEAMRDIISRLFRSPVSRGTGGFLATTSAPILRRPYENPVRMITGPLAADLGYR